MTKVEQFAALVTEVAREVIRRRSSEACCGDLTLEQFETLRAVGSAAQPTIGELARELGVEVSTMSRNVSVLERNEHLARGRSTDDGRIVHVSLTAKGRAALTTLHCGQRDVLGDVYLNLPAADRADVVQALEALRAALAARADDVAPIPLRRRAP